MLGNAKTETGGRADAFDVLELAAEALSANAAEPGAPAGA
jgi:hypothetical protein